MNTDHVNRATRAALSFAALLSITSGARADTWRGTAPFCDGECEKGEKEIQQSTIGNGGECWTGHKVLCRNNEQLCVPSVLTHECKLVVLICDNGCSSWACGACTPETDD